MRLLLQHACPRPLPTFTAAPATTTLSLPLPPQAAFLLSFGSAVDAVRFCHSAQALLLYSQWPPDCADFCGKTGARVLGGWHIRGRWGCTSWLGVVREGLQLRLGRRRRMRPPPALPCPPARPHPAPPAELAPDGKPVFKGPRVAMAVHQSCEFAAVSVPRQQAAADESTLDYMGLAVERVQQLRQAGCA